MVGRVDGIARGDHLDRVVGPLADDVDAEVAAGLEEVPALGALRVVHPSDDRTGAFDLVGLDPGGGGECLLGAEVAGGADDEMRTLLKDRCWTDLAGLVPGHGLACGGRTGGDAVAFVEGEPGDERLGGNVRVEVGGLGRREPLLEKRRAELTGRGDLFVTLGDFAREGVPARTVGVGREVEHRALAVLHVAIESALGGVPEEGGHRVEVLLRERVEFMVVALGAVGGQAEIDPAHRLHAVGGVVGEVLFDDGAAFIGRGVAALEAGGDALVFGRVGEQVAGEVLERKLVEGLIAVERLHDPVAVRPHLAIGVEVQAVRVGVAGGVEPVAGAVFAVGRQGHQLIDECRELRIAEAAAVLGQVLGQQGRCGR